MAEPTLIPQRPRIVALLPLKAHSARVPGKNFRDFLGRPLFAWILETLLSVAEIDEVVINTDARRELSAHGLTESATPRVRIRDRAGHLCGDEVSMNLVLADDVADVPADVYAMTHTTNPLIAADTIREALGCFGKARERGECDSLFTVNRFQTRFYREDGSPVNHDPENLIPTQDLEPWLEENSNLYVFTRESFAATGARIGAQPLLFEMPRHESVDIDDHDSWRHAELIGRALRGGGA